MNVTTDHWLEGVHREFLPGGTEMNVRRALVLHFTSGATAMSSVNFWRTPESKGASAHVVIDRDGTIIQCRPFNRTCGHAGKSRWTDLGTGVVYQCLNACSIGIELANAGDDAALAEHWSALQPVTARHRNGGPEQKWERFPEDQIAACLYVARAVVTRYNLDDITGHDCIAPGRKNDPGPAFPMQALREACGFAGLPVVHW